MKRASDIPDRSYLTLKHHYEHCLLEHGDTHKGMDWPNERDAKLRFDVMLDVVKEQQTNGISILDIGCGTGHLLEHICEKKLELGSYRGIDISEIMISQASEKHPDVEFTCMDLLDYSAQEIPAVIEPADYIILNGVFTEKRDMTQEQMDSFFSSMLERSFAICRKGLAFNVMSTHVDWMRDDLYHLAYDRLAEIIMKIVGRNHIIRADYGLYEYTVYTYH